jgi:hypothetical protein
VLPQSTQRPTSGTLSITSSAPSSQLPRTATRQVVIS